MCMQMYVYIDIFMCLIIYGHVYQYIYICIQHVCPIPVGGADWFMPPDHPWEWNRPEMVGSGHPVPKALEIFWGIKSFD